MKKTVPSLLAAFLLAFASAASAESIYDVPLKDIHGKDTTLAPYKGRVMLIVNVASKCGNTKQYKELQALHESHAGKGLAVLGFPCNDFGGQEPGSNEQIQEFCAGKFGVTFPLFDKLKVKGPEKHPLYALLTGPDSPFPGDVKWNFGKFLVGRDGTILARFEPRTAPDAAEVVSAIEKALADGAE